MASRSEKIDLLLNLAILILNLMMIFDSNSTSLLIFELLIPILLITIFDLKGYKGVVSYNIALVVCFILFFILLVFNHFWSIGNWVYTPFDILTTVVIVDLGFNSYYAKGKGSDD